MCGGRHQERAVKGEEGRFLKGARGEQWIRWLCMRRAMVSVSSGRKADVVRSGAGNDTHAG